MESASRTTSSSRPCWRCASGEAIRSPGCCSRRRRPVQLTVRIATEDVEVGGTVIAAGRAVFVSIGGANRDPAVFEQPDEFRIDRPDPGRHLSFSLGAHHCLGAALARLEGRIAIEELTGRYPVLEPAAPPVRRPLLVLRGLESVPVRATQMPSRSAA